MKSNDKTADFFFTTELRTERGDIRILNEEIGKMTFQRPLNYRELVPGQEYHATISVCLDEVDLEDREQCFCVLGNAINHVNYSLTTENKLSILGKTF